MGNGFLKNSHQKLKLKIRLWFLHTQSCIEPEYACINFKLGLNMSTPNLELG